jgi:hypothetical protein
MAMRLAVALMGGVTAGAFFFSGDAECEGAKLALAAPTRA